jgi:hypothetical protein
MFDSDMSTTTYDSGTIYYPTDVAWRGNVVCVAQDTFHGKYFRIDFSDSTVDRIDIGLAPLGKLRRMTYNFSYQTSGGRSDFGLRFLNTLTGTQFTKSGSKPRIISLTLNSLMEYDVNTTLEELDRIAGVSDDVLFVLNPKADTLETSQFSIWGGMRPQGSDSRASHNTYETYSRSGITFIERI